MTLQQAILIEPNRDKGDMVAIPDLWPNYFYFDQDNNLIDPVDSQGNLLTQEQIEALPNYAGKRLFLYEVGKTDYLPYWDNSALSIVVAMQKFARPDMQAQIDEWFNSGLDSGEVYQKVIEADGLIKPQDLGLDSAITFTEPQKG